MYAPCSGKALFLVATLLLTSAAFGQQGATLTIDLAIVPVETELREAAATFTHTVTGYAIQVPEVKAR